MIRNVTLIAVLLFLGACSHGASIDPRGCEYLFEGPYAGSLLC